MLLARDTCVEAQMDLLSIDGLRVDGRRPGELRRIVCEIGSISEVDGSALMSMGLTKVLLHLRQHQGLLPTGVGCLH